MAAITVTAADLDLEGNPHVIRYEGPKDDQGRDPVGYLGPSAEGVSDQRWIYDIAEASKLAKNEPERFVRAA